MTADPTPVSRPAFLISGRCEHGRLLDRCFPCRTGKPSDTPVFRKPEAAGPVDLTRLWTNVRPPSTPPRKTHLVTLAADGATLVFFCTERSIPTEDEIIPARADNVDCGNCLKKADLKESR